VARTKLTLLRPLRRVWRRWGAPIEGRLRSSLERFVRRRRAVNPRDRFQFAVVCDFKDLQARFVELVRLTGVTILCDVGAHEGDVSILVRKSIPRCEVYAFEANPQVYASFRKSLEGSGVRYLNLAIGARDGAIKLYSPRIRWYETEDGREIAQRWPAVHTIASLNPRIDDCSYTEYDVQCRALDSLFKDRISDETTDTFALWVDVEGAADLILKGASAILAKTALLFIEVEATPQWRDQWLTGDVAGLLREHHFVPVARDHWGVGQFNLLFVAARHLALLYDDLRAQLDEYHS